MLSRVADSIYWMSRYTERAENVARFIDVNLRLALDLAPGVGEQWLPLIAITAERPLFEAGYTTPDRVSVIEFLTFDEANPNSIACCLAAARDNARSVREAISSEMWEQINRFHHVSRSGAFRDLAVTDPYAFFSRIRQEAMAFAGVVDATMSHDEAWHFARVGRELERADQTSRMLDVKYFLLLPSVTDVGTPMDDLQWAALLRSASALEAYRKRHGRIRPERVAEFLILDRAFPRSILHCLLSAQESTRVLSGARPGPPAGMLFGRLGGPPVGSSSGFHNAAEQRLGRLAARLTYTGVEEIIAGGLHEFLDALQGELNSIGEAIFDTFVAPETTAPPVGPAPLQMVQAGAGGAEA